MVNHNGCIYDDNGKCKVHGCAAYRAELLGKGQCAIVTALPPCKVAMPAYRKEEKRNVES